MVAEPLIESKGLFVQITKHMERLDAHIGALDAALQERPEVLDAVGVDRTVNVVLRVLHERVQRRRVNRNCSQRRRERARRESDR